MTDWNHIKELLADIFGVGMAVFILWHLSLIALKGEFYVGEPHIAILIGELIISVGFLILTFERFLVDTAKKVVAIGRKIITMVKRK